MGVKAVPVDVDGSVVVNSDQWHDALNGLSDSLSQQQTTLHQLSEKVAEISEYGVGYDDAIGIIAIPLIIALFAFSFTFLFSVITRINNEFAGHIEDVFIKQAIRKVYAGIHWQCGVYYCCGFIVGNELRPIKKR